MSEVFNIIQEFWGSFGSAVAIIWWVALPVILFMVALEMWLKYVRTISVNKIDWVTLEISIPGLVEKTPKAMEQVFAGIYSTYSFGGNKKFLKKYWDGKIDNRVSFEMVGIDGGMHFYIRTPDSLVNLIKTSIFSQFSDAEIKKQVII